MFNTESQRAKQLVFNEIKLRASVSLCSIYYVRLLIPLQL